jgi:hypothetical protein
MKVPPMWSSGQSIWLQIQRPGFDFRRYHFFWVVGLERGLLSLVSTTEELLGRKNSGSSLEIREYGCRKPSRVTYYPRKLTLTSPTSGSLSVSSSLADSGHGVLAFSLRQFRLLLDGSHTVISGIV